MDDQVSSPVKKIFLVLSSILLTIGACGGPLITRLYFLHGGSRVWLSGWLHTGGWPIIIIPLITSYFHRRSRDRGLQTSTKLVLIKLPTTLAATLIGILVGAANYFYCNGIGHLPVSTSSLILASQLVFTSFTAFIIVKQKFDAYTVNAVVLLTVGSAVLAMHAGSDRPAGESHKKYIMGFIFTFISAAVGGAVFPLIELTYMKAKQAITFTLVMEIQIVLCIFASLVNIVGMLVNNDFQAISHEARTFQLGEASYYAVLVSIGIVWQFFTLGITGIIFCSSSLVSGIMITFLLPVTEVLAVLIYHEKFQAEKAIALVLSLWGFASHLYGQINRNKKKKKQISETEMRSNATP